MSGDLTQALRTAHSGLFASQQALDAVARNVANVNTPGYTRKIVNLEQRTLAGSGAGVHFGALTRRLDQGLLDSLRQETGRLHASQAEANILARLQDLFGTPESDSSLSHVLTTFQTAANSLATAPQNALEQKEFVRAGADLASLLRRSSATVQDLRRDSDQRIGGAVDEINGLLTSIADLNDKIVRNRAASESIADLEDSRDRALDRLSQLIDIRSVGRGSGEVAVFTASGRILVDSTPVTLGHIAATGAAASVTYAQSGFDGIYVGERGAANDITADIRTGELAGLISMRDGVLPDLQSSLDALAAQLRDTVNLVHNRGVGFPGLAELSGTRVFADPATQTITFGGTSDTVLALFDGNGKGVRNMTLRTLLGGAAGPVTIQGNAGTPAIDGIDEAIDTWLGADGTAQVTDGRLVISVKTAGLRLALRDQATSADGSARQDADIRFDADGDGGTDCIVAGFSAFFGLNDFFVDQTTGATHDSSVLDKRFAAPAGTTLTFRNGGGALGSVAVAAGDSLEDIATKLDAVPGLAATVLPDGGGFRLRIAAVDGAPITVTEAGGSLLGQLGLEPSNAGAAASLEVRADIVANPKLVSRGAVQWDPSRAPSGAYSVTTGDDTVVQQMTSALTSNVAFAAAGRLASVDSGLADYAASLIADASTLANETRARSEYQRDFVDTLRNKSDSLSGVNLDEELSDLMLYEQSYSAAARVVKVVQEMFDVLDRAMG
jgi:flagellar hook-associated protein 1